MWRNAVRPHLHARQLLSARRSLLASVRVSKYLIRPSSLHAIGSQNISNITKSQVEEIYQRKSPIEHVLLRPGMYIGSTDMVQERMWLPNTVNCEADEMKMVQKSVNYVPALRKIFDEILINALDNKRRDPSMKNLKVYIENKSSKKFWISIYNDGRGIPIQFHSVEQLYVPELIFGHLLTGSNFDDSDTRLTAGVHGYGAKLANIFSKEFVVETADIATGLKYKQVWKNSMKERTEPIITKMNENEQDFTRISFSPNLELFGMSKMTTDTFEALRKRVYDVSGCVSDITVSLNGQLVPLSGFESYMKAHQSSIYSSEAETGINHVYSCSNKYWQVGVLPSNVGFTQVSFVNGISTTRGGTHVQYLVDQITKKVSDYINKKHFKLDATAAQVKQHLAIFINCLVENPSFDSQMKEYLTSHPSTYGIKYKLSERFLKSIVQDTDLVQTVVSSLGSKQQLALAKKVASAKLKHSNMAVPKLEDANLAGGARSHECSLILTEGDSAKALAVAGLSVIGRDCFGVFPLRGKMLNVRDATYKQLINNVEFTNLCTIIGLQLNEKYELPEQRRKLRYGRIIVMADQDHDGSHIKGLLFNVLHTFWPELLHCNEFVSVFVTPIVKASISRQSKRETYNFYSLPEYMQWKSSLSKKELASLYIKYYKGLGTNSSEEAREYFSDLKKHLIKFVWKGEEDGELLDMVFSKIRASDRKDWLLREFKPDNYLCTNTGMVSYSDFVNREFIQFSQADNIRSIPSVIDGFKTSQRKVLYACLKRKLTKEIKVAQLAGYCSEHTAYHHGEASLSSTIINMAQDYVGSNNINLLYPSGQFGTRLQGGKDAASPRYIFTMLSKYTRLIFPEEDDALLAYNEDDGLQVEPIYYVPIIPMILINGAEGIGTGWSTYVPRYNPIEIIDHLLGLLSQKHQETGTYTAHAKPLLPWFRGFEGEITENELGSYVVRGKIDIINTSTLRISELPIGKSVEDYKKTLWSLVVTKKIRSYTEHHSERKVQFDVSMPRSDVSKCSEMSSTQLLRLFKLESTFSIGNMHAFDSDQRLSKYKSDDDIMQAYFPSRFNLYVSRKEHLVEKYSRQALRLKNRMRFVEQVSQGKLSSLVRCKLSKAEIIQLLEASQFTAESDFTDAELGGNCKYDYLLNMPLWSFTKEKLDKLESEYKCKMQELEETRNTTPQAFWVQELQNLRRNLIGDAEFIASAKQIHAQVADSIKCLSLRD